MIDYVLFCCMSVNYIDVDCLSEFVIQLSDVTYTLYTRAHLYIIYLSIITRNMMLYLNNHILSSKEIGFLVLIPAFE